MIEDLIGLITKHLKKGERVKIVGLGILHVRKRAARMGRNPATGEAIKIKASKKVAFRAAKELKMAILPRVSILTKPRRTPAGFLFVTMGSCRVWNKAICCDVADDVCGLHCTAAENDQPRNWPRQIVRRSSALPVIADAESVVLQTTLASVIFPTSRMSRLLSRTTSRARERLVRGARWA